MNIVMLTSVYPHGEDANKNATKVVQFFVREWVKQGHRVLVIHNMHRYPGLVHGIPRKIKNKLASRLGFDIPDLSDVRELRFEDEGALVWRLPIKKYIPHGEHPAFLLKAQVRRIQKILTEERFTPDIIMGHWMSPQIQIMAGLKKIYGCRTSLVLHGRGYIQDVRFDCRRYLDCVDVLGCRSRAEAEYVQQALKLEKRPFVCYSGVPDAFVERCRFDPEKFRESPGTWKLLYVGRLVRYKQIDKVLMALSRIRDVDFRFDIIGSGSEEEPLKKLAAELGLADRVVFHGRMPREEVLGYMQDAHCFVMISKGEVFGLVYLEAMAASCITVGSAEEGIDGVIRDGENGFLCEAGSPEALEKTLNRIFRMEGKTLEEIAGKGYATACEFTDSNVAAWYLRDVREDGNETN